MSKIERLDELKNRKKVILEELEKLSTNIEIDHVEVAQGLIDTLFTKFKSGGDWLKDTMKFAKKHIIAISPIGRVRHLWGYLHHDRSVFGAMDRRGPNSVIQGTSSDMGFKAARLMQKFCWWIKSKGIKFSYQLLNTVHDSAKGMVHIVELPIAIYFIEHAMTTQVYKEYKRIFNFTLLLDLEVEMEIGTTQDNLFKWDWLGNTNDESNSELSKPEDSGIGLFIIVEKSIDWAIQELGYNLNKKALLKHMKHNYKIIESIRRKEINMSMKKKGPSDIMLLNKNNIFDQGFYWADNYRKEYNDVKSKKSLLNYRDKGLFKKNKRLKYVTA